MTEKNEMDWTGGKPRFDKIGEYYGILASDYPDFIEKYFSIEILNRLKGVGLLCGTDWTPLYHNRFFHLLRLHRIHLFRHQKTTFSVNETCVQPRC